MLKNKLLTILTVVSLFALFKPLCGMNIFEAIESNNFTCVLELVAKNQLIVNRQGKHGNTPLHDAASKDRLGIVRILIQGGAFIDKQNEEGKTPLHMAFYKRHYQIVRELLNAGADISIWDHSGKSALKLALSCGEDIKLAKLLSDAIKRYRRKLAESLARSLHPRLGRGSPVVLLSEFLMRDIIFLVVPKAYPAIF